VKYRFNLRTLSDLNLHYLPSHLCPRSAVAQPPAPPYPERNRVFAQSDARNIKGTRALSSRVRSCCVRAAGRKLSLRARTTTHSAAGCSVEGLLAWHSPRGSADASCSRACVLPHACDIVAIGCMRPAGKAAIPAGGSELSSDPGSRGREQPAACKAGTRTFPLLGHAKGGAWRPCARRRPRARPHARPRAPPRATAQTGSAGPRTASRRRGAAAAGPARQHAPRQRRA